MITLQESMAFCDRPRKRRSPSQSTNTYPKSLLPRSPIIPTHQEHGIEKNREMIVDDIRASQAGNE
jgi:hypothetical protein